MGWPSAGVVLGWRGVGGPRGNSPRERALSGHPPPHGPRPQGADARLPAPRPCPTLSRPSWEEEPGTGGFSVPAAVLPALRAPRGSPRTCRHRRGRRAPSLRAVRRGTPEWGPGGRRDAFRKPRCALGPPGMAVPAVPGGAALAGKWVGAGSNFALKIGATEQLRAGRAGAPAVQHLSVGIKICKAEASAQPPLPPLCLVRNWCQLFDCDNCYCLGKWLPARWDAARSAGSWAGISPLGASVTPRSSAYCAQRPAGPGLRGTPIPLLSLRGRLGLGGANLFPSPHQHNLPLLMEEVGTGRPRPA